MAKEDRFHGLPGVIADSDLSTSQYKLVKLTGEFKIDVCTSSTEVPIGVLQNEPSSGEAADIMTVGMTKVQTGGSTMAAGDFFATNSSGDAVTVDHTADSDNMLAGRLIEDSAADAVATALIDCINITNNNKS